MEKKKRNKLFRVLEILLFAVYLAVLCYFLFIADRMGRTYSERVYHYNLMPFKEIVRFWTYRQTLGFWSVMLNLIGNVAAFIPYGLFLPRLFSSCRRFLLTFVLAFEFSLCVEIIQLVWKVGSFDVDDILLNTLGGAFGFLIYRILVWVKGKSGGGSCGMEEKNEKKKSL